MKTRMIILLIVATAFCRANRSDQTPWEQKKLDAKNRIRRIIYDNDGDDRYLRSSSEAPSEDGFYSSRTSFLNKYPVNSIFYNVYTSTFCPLRVKNVEPYPVPSDRVNMVPWMHQNNTDPLDLQIKYARQNNMEIFAGFRINDIHDSYKHPDDKENWLWSPWKAKHPEYLFSSWDKRPPHGKWSSLDYGQKPVRDYLLSLVKQVADQYPVDGLHFDFNRWPVLFKSIGWGADVTPEQLEISTAMMREIRKITEEAGKKHGIPILVSIRVPDSAEYCRRSGLDFESWMQEGLIDLVIAGGNYHHTPWSESVALCRKYDVRCYASIDQAHWNWVHFSKRDRIYRDHAAAFRGRAAAALEAGMDGILYFNCFAEYAVQWMHPTQEAMLVEDKIYHITGLDLGIPNDFKGATGFIRMPMLTPLYPALLPGGKPHHFLLEFGDDLPALARQNIHPEILAVVRGCFPASELQVLTNGKRWPYLSSEGEFHLYKGTAEVLNPGLNTVTLVGPMMKSEEKMLMKGDVLLVGENQPPWRRIFDGNQNPTLPDEEIVDGAYLLRDSGPARAGLLYPLPNHGLPLSLQFDCRVIQASDDQSVVMRVADGEYVEQISFSPHQIKLIYAGKLVDFDVSGAFHTYNIEMKRGIISVNADSKTLLEAPLQMTVDAPDAPFVDPDYSIPEMNESSIYLGSLSDPGTGEACWKKLVLKLPGGAVTVNDVAIELHFPQIKQNP